MGSKHNIGRDLTGTGSLSKRGWRSGQDGSWSVNRQYQHDLREGMALNFPDRIQVMGNGAWQFFSMPDDQWFEKDVPKPREGESMWSWMFRMADKKHIRDQLDIILKETNDE